MGSALLDAAGHRPSPATMPGYHRGRPPRNKGEQYPADPPTIEEIIAIMRIVGDRPDGHRLRALIVLLWRAGLRISEALSLQESDLDRSRGAVLVRRGKGGKRREVGMDRWAREQLDHWLEIRRQLPIGALLCVIHGPTAGRHWEPSAARKQLHHAAVAAGVWRRFAPHQLRRQLGHANLGITSIYLQGIDEGVPLVVIQHRRTAPGAIRRSIRWTGWKQPAQHFWRGARLSWIWRSKPAFVSSRAERVRGHSVIDVRFET